MIKLIVVNLQIVKGLRSYKTNTLQGIDLHLFVESVWTPYLDVLRRERKEHCLVMQKSKFVIVFPVKVGIGLGWCFMRNNLPYKSLNGKFGMCIQSCTKTAYSSKVSKLYTQLLHAEKERSRERKELSLIRQKSKSIVVFPVKVGRVLGW